MKTLVIIVMMVLAIPCLVVAQAPDEVVLDDYAGTGGTLLNDQIMGDTTSGGERVNPNRTYVLKRDGIYVISTAIRNTDWTLRIKAEEGSGSKPVIYTFKNTGTGLYPGEQFNVRGDFWIKNLVLIGWSTLSEDLSAMPPRLINAAAVGFSIEIDSCYIIATRAASIQTSSATHKLQVTNTVFAQSGNLFATNIGNGRPIDFRNVSVDSVIIQNCTFMDGTDRVLRHYSSVGSLNEVVFDHNTIYNALSMHGCLGLGFVGDKVTITNNLFVDNYVLGNDSTDETRLGEFGDPNERGPSGAFRMTFVGTVPNDTTEWTVANNYYAVSPEVQAWYDSRDDSADAGIGDLIPLTWHINSKLGADSANAFTKTDITFGETTRNMVPFATWYFDPDGGNKLKQNTGFTTAIDYARPTAAYYSDTLDLSYGTGLPAYTGAQGGFPVGDLNWYPSRKADWEFYITSVEDIGGAIPEHFVLAQNYPNPFNPATKIRFSIPHSGNVVLKVFNILGQEVATLMNEKREAGNHEFTFDASRLSSGVYIYRLTSGNFVASRKMVLVK